MNAYFVADDGQSDERICSITGTPEQVEAASSLIQNLIETTPAHVRVTKQFARHCSSPCHCFMFHVFNSEHRAVGGSDLAEAEVDRAAVAIEAANTASRMKLRSPCRPTRLDSSSEKVRHSFSFVIKTAQHNLEPTLVSLCITGCRNCAKSKLFEISQVQ